MSESITAIQPGLKTGTCKGEYVIKWGSKVGKSISMIFYIAGVNLTRLQMG